tara:strand:- start:3023 stop:3586 length:564 start_codon:yes stop_codon:yes gene_type:complete
MALTPSEMVLLGTEMPSFSLNNVIDGRLVNSNSLNQDRLTLVMFICAHCPYVVHIEKELTLFSRDYKDKLDIIAISSNDPIAYPQDSLENLKDQAERNDFSFPYCFDEDQSIAKAFKAQCTPDFFLFDQGDRLIYRGQLDQSRPGNDIPCNGESLRAAVDLFLEKKEIIKHQFPSIGCNIKWKSNEG